MLDNTKQYKTYGLILIVLAIAGIIFSLAGIAAIWLIRPAVSRGLTDILDLADDTLKTTGGGIDVVDEAVISAGENIVALETSLGSLGTTMDNVSLSLESSANLIGNDLRLTVTETQGALDSAAVSAELIDNVLSVVAAIPYVGARYQPAVPLHTSLDQVASNLDQVPATLDTLETSLTDTSTGLDTFSTDLDVLTDNISRLSDDVENARSVLAEYDRIIDNAQRRVDVMQKNLNRATLFTGLFLSGLLFWLAIAQMNVFLQGLGYYRADQPVVNLSDLSRD